MYKWTLLVFMLISSSLQSQIFFDLGLKGGFGGNLLINSNVFDDEDLTSKFSTAYTIGGKLGLNFTVDSGLALEAHYSGANMNYDYLVPDLAGGEDTRTRELTTNSVDLLVLYKKTGLGQYVEIGGQYSVMNKANLDDRNAGLESLDILPGLDKNRLSAVIGFGSNIAGGDMSLVSLGLRVKYDLNDLFANEDTQLLYGQNYTDYQSTNPLTAFLVLEFNQGIGYASQRSCPKRVKYFNYD